MPLFKLDLRLSTQLHCNQIQWKMSKDLSQDKGSIETKNYDKNMYTISAPSPYLQDSAL